MTTPMAPGPASIGIAIGLNEMSSFCSASAVSAGVVRLVAVTIAQAVCATMSPPAIRNAGSEIPKNSSTHDPASANASKIAMT